MVGREESGGAGIMSKYLLYLPVQSRRMKAVTCNHNRACVRGAGVTLCPPLFDREYESLYTSHIWIPSSWCSLTEGPECDVTDDITATVPYNLRVRATLGSQTSAWSILKHPFNRNSSKVLLSLHSHPHQPLLWEPCSPRLSRLFFNIKIVLQSQGIVNTNNPYWSI